jgi:short-subunit dehydrogenase
MRLEHARVLITGASGGIGLALARRFRRAGAALLLTARDPARLARAQAELGDGAPVDTLAADLLEPGGIAAVAAAAERYGVDVLVNNAGAASSTLFAQTEPAAIERVVALDLLAPIQLTRALLPRLLQRQQAAVVNIGSVFGSIGYPGSAAYCAAKFGLRGFSEALRRELADSAVAVCYVAPRAVATAFNAPQVVALNRELGNREDAPEVVADAVAAAIERRAAVTLIGQPEGLFARINALLPALVDGAIRRQLPAIRRHLAA